MADKHFLTRLAPTPSGFLHIGNALSFAVTASIAAKSNAEVFLRIDDLDQERTRPEYIQDVFDTLDQLGIKHTQGPRSVQELENEWSQSLRTQAYSEVIECLKGQGHLYSCGCSRKDLDTVAPNSPDHACRNRITQAADKPLRIKLPKTCIAEFNDELMGHVSVDLNKEMPDFIVKRRDGLPSYQVASLVDDVEFGVNIIVRGEDLLASTAAQIYLAKLLGFDRFIGSRFYHHRLLTSESGEKLSKSEGSDSLKSMRETGSDTKLVYQQLSALLKIGPKANDLESFTRYIDLQKLTQP